MSFKEGEIRQKTCRYARPRQEPPALIVDCTRDARGLMHSVLDCARCIHYETEEQHLEWLKSRRLLDEAELEEGSPFPPYPPE